MSPGHVFDRVYHALRLKLSSGALRPGEPLEPALLSHELNASNTPVRDALHRLAGERLVETPRGDGFRVPYVTEVGLRDLYEWTNTLLLLACRNAELPHHEPDRPLSFASPDAISESGAKVLLACASRAPSPEHRHAIAGLLDRLAPARHMEARLLHDMADDLRAIDALFTAPTSDRKALRALLTAYHRKRVRAAPRIVAALLAPR